MWYSPLIATDTLSFCFMLYNILFESGNKIFLFYYSGSPEIRDVTPSGYTLYEGDTLSMTCYMEGGNPLATLTWEDCPNLSPNTGTNSTTAWNRVSGRVTKDLNGRRCRCIASHITWNSQTKTVLTGVFTVYCK